MLWYKGWLETRFRLVFALSVITLLFIVQRYGSPRLNVRGVIFFAGMSVALLCIFLAAGIVTQPGLQAAKGLHGSTLFTLTLPVSRLRLLAVRAALGWLEMFGGIAVVCGFMWFLFPIIRDITTPGEMAEQAVVMAVCGSLFYATTVLMATFLDDLWRVWGSFLSYGAIWWIGSRIPGFTPMNIFEAMGDQSPILKHTIPWAAMAFAAVLSAALFFAALKVAQTREY